MSQTFEIVNDVPMPKKPASLPKLPLGDMEVGESFLISGINLKMKLAIRGRLARYQRSHHPRRFSMIQETDTSVRVFRVENYK